MQFPAQLKYHPEHLWVRDDADGKVTVGITDFAQDQLGQVVYIDLPEVGDDIAAGDEMGAVESAKSVSDLIAPVSGQVLAVNQDLLDEPSPLNNDPYGKGWIAQVKLADPAELAGLLSAEDYQALIDG